MPSIALLYDVSTNNNNKFSYYYNLSYYHCSGIVGRDGGGDGGGESNAGSSDGNGSSIASSGAGDGDGAGEGDCIKGSSCGTGVWIPSSALASTAASALGGVWEEGDDDDDDAGGLLNFRLFPFAILSTPLTRFTFVVCALV